MSTFKSQDRQSHELDLSVAFDNMVIANPDQHRCAYDAMNRCYEVQSLIDQGIEPLEFEGEGALGSSLITVGGFILMAVGLLAQC